uniref:tubulin delta chain n=1 Tax=Myxine glutinosa TaxID=7769 RepID=UPI00358F89DB
MAVVTVQVGQCGSQVGSELLTHLWRDAHDALLGSRDRDYRETSLERFFGLCAQGKRYARAVLVDMEPKAVRASLASARRAGWSYHPHSAFYQQRGSGNNWAYGYGVAGTQWGKDVMAIVRMQVEQCDRLAGFLPMLSLAGGTGSGLGSRLTQLLRDEYPKALIVNHVTWPFSSGEVIVQSYNAMLSLAALHDASDAVLFHENDGVHDTCRQHLGLARPGLRDINRLIAQHLATMMQPAHPHTLPFYSCDPLGDLTGSLVPSPEFRLLSVQAVPELAECIRDFTCYLWTSLLRDLSTDSRRCNPMKSTSRPSCVSRLLVLRGKDTGSAEYAELAAPSSFPAWVPPERGLTVWTCSRPFGGHEKSAALLTNEVPPSLNDSLRRAWDMFNARAYVHQYIEHGVTEDDFLSSFSVLEQVLSSYRHL